MVVARARLVERRRAGRLDAPHQTGANTRAKHVVDGPRGHRSQRVTDIGGDVVRCRMWVSGKYFQYRHPRPRNPKPGTPQQGAGLVVGRRGGHLVKYAPFLERVKKSSRDSLRVRRGTRRRGRRLWSTRAERTTRAELTTGAARAELTARAARAHRAAGEPPLAHRRSAVVGHRGALPVMVPASVPAAAGMPAEDEAGEEDNRDDEYDTGDDPDPRCDRVEPAVAVVPIRRRRPVRSRCRLDGRWFSARFR